MRSAATAAMPGAASDISCRVAGSSLEAEFGGKAHGPDDAQRVVQQGIRSGCPNAAIAEVLLSAQGVDQFTERAPGADGDRHGVDRKIATAQVILDAGPVNGDEVEEIVRVRPVDRPQTGGVRLVQKRHQRDVVDRLQCLRQGLPGPRTSGRYPWTRVRAGGRGPLRPPDTTRAVPSPRGS